MAKYNIIFTFVVCSALLFRVESMVAYDCEQKSLNLTTISLTTLPSCQFLTNNTLVENVYIAVTQTQERREITFSRCIVESNNIVTRCGKSIDTMYEGGLYTDILPMDRATCTKMIKDKIYILRKGDGISELMLSGGGFQKHNYLSRGSVDGSFSCNPGTSFTRNGYHYDRPLVNTELKLTYAEGVARVNYEENKIFFPNGNTCKYSDGECFSAEYGKLFWEIEQPQCRNDKDQKSLVYMGQASLITVLEKDSRATFVQVEYSGYSFQIELRNRNEFICGFRSSYTEHPKLFVTIISKDGPDFPQLNEVSTLDVSLLNYVNSKIVYSMKHVKNEVNRLFELFQLERCKTNNRVTQNLLTLAILSPVNFAYMYGGEGHTAVQRGEVIYLAQCKPVSVQFDLNRPGCFNEIPVSYNNRSLFLHPRTRVLINLGVKVDCLPEMAPKFQIEGKWYMKSDHGLIEVKTPDIISTDEIKYEFQELKGISDGGLYTRETMEKYQSIITSPMVEGVVGSTLMSTILGSEQNNDIKFSNAFSPADFEVIGKNINGWFTQIALRAKDWGSWFGFIMLCFGGWKLIIYLISCIVNFRMLYTEGSFWVAIFACWLDSITHSILHKEMKKNIGPKLHQFTPEEIDSMV